VFLKTFCLDTKESNLSDRVSTRVSVPMLEIVASSGGLQALYIICLHLIPQLQGLVEKIILTSMCKNQLSCMFEQLAEHEVMQPT
jgi:hypothetical protein